MERKRKKVITDADQQIRKYYENQPPSETEAFPDLSETTPTSEQLIGKVSHIEQDRSGLNGGDPDVSPQGIDAGTETPGGSEPTPDQDLVDEIGKAAGVTYQDDEPLNFGKKIAAQDEARWELNPASSEDFEERQSEFGRKSIP
ncbi:MAG: DUF6335 family protein [Nitrospira sp.]